MVLCSFLLYSDVNQAHVYTYPLPLGLPSHPAPPSRPLGHHGAPSWAPRALHQLPASFLVHTWWCIHINPNLPVHLTPASPAQVHTSNLYIFVSIPALKIGSSVPFFSWILHICVNKWYLSYFFWLISLYDRLLVHPHLYKWPSFIPFYRWVIFHIPVCICTISSLSIHLLMDI